MEKTLDKARFFALILLASTIVSCNPNTPPDKTVQAENLNDLAVSNNGVQILVIDKCEYVWCKNGYGAGLTHKGNCKNHIR